MDEFPSGFMPIGDTTTSINPTFGQGMTLAVFHAVALGNALKNHAPNTTEFRTLFWQEAMRASATAWRLSSATDLQYDWVSGDRPDDFAQRIAFSKGIKLLANDDLEIQKLVMEVFHMERSADVLSSPEFIQKVTEKLTV